MKPRLRPLLAYTCDAALASKHLSRVILSTDDREIAAFGRKYGVEAPFERPSELACDDTPSVEVAEHAIDWLMEHEGWDAEVLVLLQPTSPLRTSTHIDEALECLWKNDGDSVVSVREVPHGFSPYSVMRLEEGILQDFIKDPLPFDRFSRQSLPTLYARNGPAVLACRTEVIRQCHSFYRSRTVPFVMSEEDSIDIDTPFDVDGIFFIKDPLPFDRFSRQSLPTLYARNGPAVLACRTEVIRQCHSFYRSRTVPFVMSEEDSIDIDTPFDLHLAELLLQRTAGVP